MVNVRVPKTICRKGVITEREVAMKYNMENVRTINGHGMADGQVASDFINECIREVDTRLSNIAKLKNLEIVLSGDALSDARSDLAGIRHINAALDEAAGFHVQGQLGYTFANAAKTVSGKLVQAEAIVTAMALLYN